jgi:hypothetical protein
MKDFKTTIAGLMVGIPMLRRFNLAYNAGSLQIK